jgi:type II secretion system protein N
MMKVIVKIGVFCVLFVLFLVWRFPYDSLVERAVRQAEVATGATILYQPSSAGPFGVKVKDLHVQMASGASLKFDSARIFPTSEGLTATAYQGESEMKVSVSGKVLDVKLKDVTVQTGNDVIGTTRATGEMTYAVATREGGGSLRLVVPELGLPIPIPDKSVELGSTFVIRNVGTPELPRTGVSTELKLLSGDGSSSANGTVSLEGQPPPNSPLLNGTLRFEVPTGRGTLRLSGTWDNPVTKIIPK